MPSAKTTEPPAPPPAEPTTEVAPVPDDRPPPSNVIEALSRIMAELPSIGKDERAPEKAGGYAYRGIEAITKHLQPLLAKYGVVMIPEVIEREVRDVTVNNNPWTDVYLTVRYTIYGPGGVDDSVLCVVNGIGRDNNDKGANKAMSQALKYATLQVFCISDAEDDADRGSPPADRQRSAVRRNQGPMRDPEGEATSAGNVRQGPRIMAGFDSIEQQRDAHDEYRALVDTLDDQAKESLRSWRVANVESEWPMTADDLTRCTEHARLLTFSDEPFDGSGYDG